jgi:hypothetical protein
MKGNFVNGKLCTCGLCGIDIMRRDGSNFDCCLLASLDAKFPDSFRCSDCGKFWNRWDNDLGSEAWHTSEHFPNIHNNLKHSVKEFEDKHPGVNFRELVRSRLKR